MHVCKKLDAAIKANKIWRLGGGYVAWPNPNYPAEPLTPIKVCPYCNAPMFVKLSG